MRTSRLIVLACLWASAHSVAASAANEAVTLAPVEVSAGLVNSPIFSTPASIDLIEGEQLRNASMQVDLSERLEHVPGLLIRNRHNYAQDLQLSIRGFGARSTFGVRGVRLYVDGIPATMPDGQGQTSNIDIASVDHIEVLRGPFSALYGNSSGGVVQVFTRPGDAPASLGATFTAGSENQRKLGIVADGATADESFRYLLSVNRYQTDGYRTQSAARKDTSNARLDFQVNDRHSLRIVANWVDLRADDPQGLTYDEAMSAPRQAAPNALAYDTRKSVRQTQAGIVQKFLPNPDNELRLSAYFGKRKTLQFLGIPRQAQLPPGHSGGVVDLTRDYSGVDMRWTTRLRLSGRPFTLAAGLAFDTLVENRQGYENFVGEELGVKGAKRRDEVNKLRSTDPYLQASWELTERWLLEAGARHSDIRFRSVDHYIAAGNGDDGGSVRYRKLLPVGAIQFRATENINLYLTAGKGFETPTFNEISYRPDATPGLNLELAPSTSTSIETGAKVRLENSMLAAAVFQTRSDNEIVAARSQDGRSSYRNAGRSRRTGFELGLSGSWKQRGKWMLSYTWLDARYTDDLAADFPGGDVIQSGNRIPGVARQNAYASISWEPPTGWRAGLESRVVGRVMANDANSAAAAGYFTASIFAGHVWKVDTWKIELFARVDNLLDRRYMGSLIVNAGQGRYFEPAPGRNWTAGVGITHGF